MKKIPFLLLLLPFLSFSQKRSCCAQSSTEAFANLSSDKDFAFSHAAPLPLTFEAKEGNMIKIACSNGPSANAFEIKAAEQTDFWIVIFHEWWGLNDYIKREAEKFSDEFKNCNILALDLYDGVVASNPEDAQRAMGNMKDERARMIIESALRHVGENGKIATIGWCMGGGWSLQASIIASKQSLGCVMYYGMPETDESILKNLNADVLGIFALQDKWITQEIVSKFQTIMERNGKKLDVKNYDTVHAFANPSNPNFNAEYASDAHRLVVEFLKERLKE